VKRPSTSLSFKIFVVAFLNIALLALVFLTFARMQFRFDLRSFFLAPARYRIFSVSNRLTEELLSTPMASWNKVLADYSSNYPAQFFLFRDSGEQIAGETVKLPDALLQTVHNQPGPQRGMGGGPPFEEDRPRLEPPRHMGPPPLTIMRSGGGSYWAGVHVPLWAEPRYKPMHATLVWRFNSFWTDTFFFDYRPFLAFILALVVVCVACWLPLIRSLTRAISQLTLATGQIAEGHFEIATSIRRSDELGRLSESISQMAQRLAGLVHGQRRFLSDIAHELSSPLARMQLSLSILEQRTGEDEVDYVVGTREEVEHMAGLVSELLAFSRSQAPGASIELTKVNIAETVRRVLEREASDNAQIEVQVDEAFNVIAQPEYLFRSIANVVRNAIRYAAHAGPILVSTSKRSNEVTITVADNGPGLPDSELENVFRPFYRPEFARQRETGGVGLGLAIVRSCIESCGGAVKCRNRSPRGLEVEIRLHLAAS